jgi:hypothetical protein
MAVGVYDFAVFASDFGLLFAAFTVDFAGFFVRARFFMARNLQ